jgi:predicted PurR-regulated permease PerM
VFLNKKYAKYIIEISCSSNNIFEKFLIGKLLDSMIVGILFFFVSAIMKLPYPPLLSLLIGITNMIPFYGPFIWAVPVVLIVMLSNMSLALWTVLVIFVLQQFDGIVIGPKILGDSTGLKPMQVILAITLGGFFGGILGMFLGVPVFAVIWNMFMNIIDSRYESKKID